MRFDSTLRERWSRSGDGWIFQLPSGWMQGRSAFGGLTVAAGAALAGQHVEAGRRLRTFTAQLLRPVDAGELRGAVRVVREGKAASFVEVRLGPPDTEVALVTMVFTKPRVGAMNVLPTATWTGPDPESLEDIPFVAGVTPEFTQQVAMRWAGGGLPFSGSDDTHLCGYCRFRDPAGDAEGIIGLLDMFPSPSVAMLTSPAPSSTVTWSAHIFRAPAALDGWCGFTYETIRGLEGFHTVAGHLYGPDGELLAWSEQLVAVYEPVA